MLKHSYYHQALSLGEDSTGTLLCSDFSLILNLSEEIQKTCSLSMYILLNFMF